LLWCLLQEEHKNCFVHQKMFDHADEVVAALVVCLAAGYAVRLIWDWRGAQKLRREIEYLDSQGRQIFKLIADEDKKPVVFLLALALIVH
jgi:hypothetical protein